MGWGYCPTNIPQWNQKYKVAFALLDSETNEVRYTFVDTNTDLSKWIKEVPLNMYLSRICPKLKRVLMFGLWAWLTGVIKIS